MITYRLKYDIIYSYKDVYTLHAISSIMFKEFIQFIAS